MKKQCKKYTAWLKSKEGKEKKSIKKHVAKKCHHCNTDSEDDNECESLKEEAHVCLKVAEFTPEAEAWYLDSGASSHMTSRREVLQNLDSNIQGTVTIADGRQLRIEGKGTTTLKPNRKDAKEISLQKVLYVPELNSSLLSVSRITKNGCAVLLARIVS